MPLSSIVGIVIRVFALIWGVHALNLILAVAAAATRHRDSGGLMNFASGLTVLFGAVGIWYLAPHIARLVTRPADASVNVGGLSRSDLYSFAFVFLGLYFILSSIADVMDWVHYFTTVSKDDPRNDPSIQNFYDLTRPCLTLLAGLLSLLGAPRWTKKLVSRDAKSQTPEARLKDESVEG
jgi:hypothetical protein